MYQATRKKMQEQFDKQIFIAVTTDIKSYGELYGRDSSLHEMSG